MGILERQLEDEAIPNSLRAELRNELGGILKRWRSSRTEEEADQKKKRPFLNSYEWGGIEKESENEFHFGCGANGYKRPQRGNGYGWEV